MSVADLKDVRRAASRFDGRLDRECPRTQRSEGVLFGDMLGFFSYIRRNPFGEGDLYAHVSSGRCVFISNLRDLARFESARDPDQRRPEAAMDERDLGADNAADQDVF